MAKYKKGSICNEKCPQCHRHLIVLTESEVTCPMGHGKLIQHFSVMDIKKKGDI